jgi:hypothetical protein
MRRQFVLPPTDYKDWMEFYFESGRYDKTLHGFHGALTELIRDKDLTYLMVRNNAINAFMNHEVPVLLGDALDKKTFSFDALDENVQVAQDKAREDAKASRRLTKEGVRKGWQEQQRAAKDKAREEKAAAKAEKKAKEAKAPDAPAPKKAAATGKKKAAIKAEKKAGPTEGLALPKPTAKKARQTARVKVREQIAAEAKPVKTKVGKAPKGEVVKKARKAKADPDEVFFCAGCEGEFKAADVKKVNGELYCKLCRQALENPEAA